MVKKTRTIFFLILLLTFIALIIDLPENFRIGSYTVNPPVIDIAVGSIKIKKEFKTQLGLDLAGGTHVGLEADMKEIPKEQRLTALESARQVIERRVNFFGVSESLVQEVKSGESYRITVELPGITDVTQALSLIGQTAKLEFREFTKTPNTASEAAMMVPFLDNTTPVGVTGKDLKSAKVNFSNQTGEPEVAISFSQEGTKKFSEVTTRLVGKSLAIFLDDMPLTWPTVSVPITDGEAVITGTFTLEQAKQLALQLNAGALPVPVNVVEKRTVGATLGAESVNKSVRAGIIGLSIVLLFMVIRYGWLGLFADFALIVYGLITLALYRLIPITLTLPGIAGFILSIGMAVDSNILIFERYKEELHRGKPWHIAMELGFGKAWDSIRDANFMTIMTSLILYNPGNWDFLPTSGLIRGFAATLFLGVVISLFTGIIVTRTFIRVLYRGPKGGTV